MTLPKRLRTLFESVSSWSRPAWFLLASAGLTGVIFLFVRVFVLDITPVALISAQSTFVTYEVQRGPASNFTLQGAQLRDRSQVCEGILDGTGRFTGLVAPGQGNRVSYTHHRSHLLITLDIPPGTSAAELTVEGHAVCKVQGDTLNLLVPNEVLDRHLPFPIVGRGEIGAELRIQTAPVQAQDLIQVDDGHGGFSVRRAPGPLLMGATVRLFGRTSTLSGTGQLYPIPDAEFQIPRGSRLSSTEEPSTMVGTVTAAADDFALDVEVTLEASEVLIYRIGQRDQVERLAVGAFARSFSNPGLVPILVAIAIFGFILQLLCALDGVVRDKRGRR
ncbi:hypothetical protein GEU84_019600 [Fertoebacter nigrum]|uniref:Uncharacterized protein n=1 Tax=Fertoeibacter niger TaxID=2656921 RepID=A0A8X8H0L4_9RHOB|nr:hypothetical protein [Fertoeibacter niger]NUB46602.1 hypothetical protein [Fertoeibacter niger]